MKSIPMTEFSNTLLSAITATQTSQRKISQQAEIDVSILSKVISGQMLPSANVLQKLCTHLNPQHFPHLTKDYSNELLIAYLRDCAKDSGLDTSELDIRIGPHDPTRRFAEFPTPLADTLYALGKGAQADKEFANILDYFEPIALRHLGQLFDKQEKARRYRAARRRSKEQPRFRRPKNSPKS